MYTAVINAQVCITSIVEHYLLTSVFDLHKRFRLAQVVLFLQGICKGSTTSQMARERGKLINISQSASFFNRGFRQQ